MPVSVPMQSLPPSAADEPWRAAPADPSLAGGALHVWRVDLSAAGDDLLDLLSAPERARARRIRRELDGRLWGRARGALRKLLGRYLGSDPRALCFAAEERGKPVLAGQTATPRSRGGPSFNMSHSRELALYAFAEFGAVGVDVEVARRPIDELALAARAFGPRERRRLEELDPELRTLEFLRSWVRHEAALKCRGGGLGAGPPGDGASELWSAQLQIGPRAAGAVAAEERPGELCCWDF